MHQLGSPRPNAAPTPPDALQPSRWACQVHPLAHNLHQFACKTHCSPLCRFIRLVCKYLELALVVNKGRELMPVIHQRRECTSCKLQACRQYCSDGWEGFTRATG